MKDASGPRACALLVLVLFASGWVPPNAAGRDVAIPHVFADGTFVFDAPLQVGPGQHVIIRNATVHFDYRDPCLRGCQVPAVSVQGGTLTIVDSIVDTTRTDSGFSIILDAGTMRVDSSDVSGYSVIAAQLPGPGRSHIRDSTFHDASGPVTFIRGADIDVLGSVFESSSNGIAVRDANATIVGNRFTSIRAPGRALDVQATLVGEKSIPTIVRVEDNLIERSWWGMLHLAGAPDVIANNSFVDDGTALLVSVQFGEGIVHAEPPIITGNTFRGSRLSLVIALAGTSASYPTVHVPAHGNAFQDTTCTHLAVRDRVDAKLVVDATANWWGSPTGPSDLGEACPAVIGTHVTVAPWLDAWPIAS